MKKLIKFVFGLLIASIPVATFPKIANPNEIVSNTYSAKAIFEIAYNNRYTWRQNFPGYTATVIANYSGQQEQGIVTVYPDFEVEVKDIENPEIVRLIEGQVSMEINHRRNIPFERVHGQSSFKVNGENANVTEIEKVGEDNSSYKIEEQKIVQVNRSMGEEITVTVDTLKTTETPEGYLASEYLSTFRNSETDEILEEAYAIDEHQIVGNYYLLASRNVFYDDAPNMSETPDISIKFENFQLL